MTHEETIDYERLSSALRIAIAGAEDHIKDMADTGTCNMDSVFIFSKREDNSLVGAIQRAGGQADRHTSKYWTGYFVRIAIGGQANTRAAAVDFVVDALRDGFPVAAFRMMD